MGKFETLIIKQIKVGMYILTVHARERMNERFISNEDIISVAKNLKTIKKQEINDTYLLNGTDSWGEELNISVALKEKLIIVTVFL